jgi:hypothetical protein
MTMTTMISRSTMMTRLRPNPAAEEKEKMMISKPILTANKKRKRKGFLFFYRSSASCTGLSCLFFGLPV